MRQIVLDYLKLYPELKDYTLAAKIYKENPKVFINLERARHYVRYYRGHKGEKSRKRLRNKETMKPLNYDTKNQQPFREQTGANVLILDIETAPIRAYVWGIWQQNVALNQIESDWFCLTWAAKWLFEDKVYSAKLQPREVLEQNDSRIIKGIWELVNKADIVIAHNGEKFDIPKLNTRFIINNLEPPLPYLTIDTLKHIRRKFGFTSNKLDYVNKILNLHRKSDTGGFELWERCMQGDKKALAEMEGYNINDVRILEETYLAIRGWITPHPNIGLHILDEKQSRCPNCGSDELQEQGKKYYTSANVYEMYRCKNCGATNRKRLSSLTIKERRHLIMPSR